MTGRPVVARSGSANWSVDFTSRSRDHGELPSPPGFSFSVSQAVETAKANDASLVTKRSWDMALSPLKQVPMNLFMMYMSGDSISIFPLMMIGMLVLRTLKTLFSIQKSFQQILGQHAYLQRFIYLVGNVANLVLALYKCHSLGLLPTHASDWLAFVEPQQRVELSLGGLAIVEI